MELSKRKMQKSDIASKFLKCPRKLYSPTLALITLDEEKLKTKNINIYAQTNECRNGSSYARSFLHDAKTVNTRKIPTRSFCRAVCNV